MPAVEPPKKMITELARLTERHTAHESRSTREALHAAIVRWHDELGPGSLSLIARTAGLSRVQVGRIVKAAEVARETGQPIQPTRRYYQARTQRPGVTPAPPTSTPS